jgi:hypothetical protein
MSAYRSNKSGHFISQQPETTHIFNLYNLFNISLLLVHFYLMWIRWVGLTAYIQKIKNVHKI